MGAVGGGRTKYKQQEWLECIATTSVTFGIPAVLLHLAEGLARPITCASIFGVTKHKWRELQKQT